MENYPKEVNSGIFYHLRRYTQCAAHQIFSPEYQIIDDENYDKIHASYCL